MAATPVSPAQWPRRSRPKCPICRVTSTKIVVGRRPDVRYEACFYICSSLISKTKKWRENLNGQQGAPGQPFHVPEGPWKPLVPKLTKLLESFLFPCESSFAWSPRWLHQTGDWGPPPPDSSGLQFWATRLGSHGGATVMRGGRLNGWSGRGWWCNRLRGIDADPERQGVR